MEKLGNGLNRILANLGLDWLQYRDGILRDVRQYLRQRNLASHVDARFHKDTVILVAPSAPVRQELSLLQGELLARLQARWGPQVQNIKILRGRKK